MKSTRKSRRHRNPHIQEKKQEPFFSKTNEQSAQSKSDTAFFQTKLTIGQPNDKYEKEADSMADAVVNKTNQQPSIQQKEISNIQRATSPAEEEPVQMMEEEEETVQTKANQNTPRTASENISQKIKSTQGRGNPMNDKTRAEMEQGFGYDFSGVNVHTGQDAVQMNKELGAQAFTHGQDVYFNAGKYNPDSQQGKHLLAHELTHVVQQNQNSSQHRHHKYSQIQEKTIQREISEEDLLASFPTKAKDRDEIITEIRKILDKKTEEITDPIEKENKQRELLNDPQFAPRLMKALSKSAGHTIEPKTKEEAKFNNIQKNITGKNLFNWNWTIRHYTNQKFDTIKSTAELSIIDKVKSENTNDRDWTEVGNVGYTFFLISIDGAVPKRTWLSNMKYFAEFKLNELNQVWVSGDMLEEKERSNIGLSGQGANVRNQLIKLLLSQGGDISSPQKAVETLDAIFGNKIECKIPGSVAAKGNWNAV